MKQTPLLILVAIIVGLVVFMNTQQSKFETSELTSTATIGTCIPTFQDGGGPYYEANTPFRENIAPEDHQGTVLTIKGKVLASDCTTPLTNLVVDVWQANESGNYEDEWYRGRVKTDANGNYQFSTVIPKGYGEGTAFRPPHIHFKIWDGNRLLVTSQMFLPQSREQGIEEAYIMDVSQQTDGSYVGDHDIVVP